QEGTSCEASRTSGGLLRCGDERELARWRRQIPGDAPERRGMLQEGQVAAVLDNGDAPRTRGICARWRDQPIARGEDRELAAREPIEIVWRAERHQTADAMAGAGLDQVARQETAQAVADDVDPS